MRRRHGWWWLVALLMTGLRAAPAAPPTQTVRLLTVGNSFSQNATTHLEALAKAAGCRLIHHACVIGGGTLAQHWEKVTQLAADPNDPRGRYRTGKTLQEELVAEPWDFVTIQQASIRSHDITTYRPYAAQLQEFIKRYAPQAKLLVHQTWAYRVDDPRFAVRRPKPGEPASQQAMHDLLTSAYQTIAKELGAGLLPVGNAFHLADTDPTWGFRPDTTFNPKTAVEPQLPNQTHSLHTGYRWAKNKDGQTVLSFDGHHAGTAGQYLGACVWFEILYARSVVDNAFVPKTLPADYAAWLRACAHRAVTG